GTFYGGRVKIEYFNKNGKHMAHEYAMEVSPMSEIVINQGPKDIVTHAHSAQYQLESYDNEIVGVFGEIKLPGVNVRE
ncbi:MAG: hypothetical protein HOC71_07840, partial [Candidatus Latescibacteria bacterium]|nr:hypothetical protein [Candidatus Latescibacterota bacterium]